MYEGGKLGFAPEVQMLLTGGRTDYMGLRVNEAKKDAAILQKELKREKIANWTSTGLQVAGTVAGGIVGGPVGAMVGNSLTKAASSVISGAIEGDLSHEDVQNAISDGTKAVATANFMNKPIFNSGDLQSLPGGMDAYEGPNTQLPDSPTLGPTPDAESYVAMYGGNLFGNVQIKAHGGFLDFKGDSHSDSSLGINMTKDGAPAETFVQHGETAYTFPDGTFVFTNDKLVPKEVVKELIGSSKKDMTYADLARFMAQDLIREQYNPLVISNTEEMLAMLKEKHLEHVPESRDPMMAGLNNQIQGAAFGKYGGDLHSLGKAAASVNLLIKGGQNPPGGPPNQTSVINPELRKYATQFASQPQATVSQVGNTYHEQMPEEYRDEVFNAEGGLSSDKNDAAAADIKGIKGAKYHTNMGLRYKTYKELAKKVLGVNPNYKHFENLSEDDLKAFQDYYWRASGAHMVKDSRLGFIMFHNMWGGTNWKRMANYINERYDVSLKDKDDIIEFMNEQDTNDAVKILGDHLYDWRLTEYLPSTPTWKKHGNGWTIRENRMRETFNKSFDENKVAPQEDKVPDAPLSPEAEEAIRKREEQGPPAFEEKPKPGETEADINAAKKRKAIENQEAIDILRKREEDKYPDRGKTPQVSDIKRPTENKDESKVDPASLVDPNRQNILPQDQVSNIDISGQDRRAYTYTNPIHQTTKDFNNRQAEIKAAEEAKARDDRFEAHRRRAEALRNIPLGISGGQAIASLFLPRNRQAISARNITNPDVAETLDINPIRADVDRQVRTGNRMIKENVNNAGQLVAGVQGNTLAGARAISDAAFKKQQFDADEFNRWAQMQFQTEAFNSQMENTIFNQNAADEAGRTAAIMDAFSELGTNAGLKGLNDMRFAMTEKFPYNAYGDYNAAAAAGWFGTMPGNPNQLVYPRNKRSKKDDETTV